jgi:hypothetical protein
MPDYGTPPARPKPKYGAYASDGYVSDETLRAERQQQEAVQRLADALVRDFRGRSEPTRSWFGVTLALALLGIASALGIFASQGGWLSLLWVPFAPFAFFGVVGFIIDIRKVPRDENGSPL